MRDDAGSSHTSDQDDVSSQCSDLTHTHSESDSETEGDRDADRPKQVRNVYNHM